MSNCNYMNSLKKILTASLMLLSFSADAQVNLSKNTKDSGTIGLVEPEAIFPGGSGAWYRFLSNNLNTYIATDNGARSGSYTVKVQFWIDTAGRVSEVKALTNFGFGIEEELIRVINKSPLWIPAKQNGRLVSARKLQAITFRAEK